MVKTMRACLVLGSIFLAAGQTAGPGPQAPVGPGSHQRLQAHCAVNSILVADELMNSVIFIWQGVLRCGKGHNSAECSVDISSAIQSVTGVIDVIMKTVATCGDTLDLKAACASSVSQVVSSMAGVSATASGIAEHCPKTSIQPVAGLQQAVSQGNPPFSHALAFCIVDVKNLIKSVIRVSLRIADASNSCKTAHTHMYGTLGCTADILNILGAVGEMGEYIAGVVGHCSKPENEAAACASEVLGLLRNLAELSQAGTHMSIVCALTADEQLYLDNDKEGVKTPATMNSNLPTFALAALLPMTAVLSFVAGRRIAKFRQEPAADEEMAPLQ